MVLSVAAPVQRYKQVLGRADAQQDLARHRRRGARRPPRHSQGLRRRAGGHVLLSLYLARTIARPILRLAAAAEAVRRGPPSQADLLPDFGDRSDEIGQLAAALREMTEALWQRMDAIERFAADVSHEIKNPLSSLRSAVETAARVNDPDKRRKLLDIIQQDVQRLDRLISDISDASRLDAELSRAETEPVDVGQMLATLVDVTEADRRPAADPPRLDIPQSRQAGGQRDRGPAGAGLSQPDRQRDVVQPAGRLIMLKAARRNGMVVTEVLDEGPGIPEGKEKDIFVRFYSERPHGEKFGIHSGLGPEHLEADRRGARRQRRRREPPRPNGGVKGARFIVRLPVA